MERLTFEGNFCDIAQCKELPCKHGGDCTQKKVWERLKAYEDARLSPQACAEAREIEETLSGCDYSISQMVELMKADVEGRVLILPCKVGDTVFARLDNKSKYVCECKVKQIVLGDIGFVTFAPIGAPEREYDVSLRGFGKTVFLSREEAEKALQEMEGKKDGNETSM